MGTPTPTPAAVGLLDEHGEMSHTVELEGVFVIIAVAETVTVAMSLLMGKVDEIVTAAMSSFMGRVAPDVRL